MDFATALLRLLTLYDQGRLVPFVGLGMSRPTCSDWRQNINLLAAAANDLKLGTFPDMINVDRDNLPRWANQVVSLLKRATGTGFSNVMREALYLKKPDQSDFLPPQTRALAQLYWPLILTTNYDDLLYRAVSKNFPLVVRGRSWYDCDRVVAGLSGPEPSTLWALQGFLPFDDALFSIGGSPDATMARAGELSSQIVVGHEEYRRVTHREPWFRRAFAEVFRSRSFLFLGSGLAESYLIELFGETLEMTGMSPYPHYAFIQEGEVDPDFLRSRLNILVVEYPKGEHGTVAKRLNEFAEAAKKERPRPASVGFTMKTPSSPVATPDLPDLLLVRGLLPIPGPDECAGICCGRRYTRTGEAAPLLGAGDTSSDMAFLADHPFKPDGVNWIDAEKTLIRFLSTVAGTHESPYFGLFFNGVMPSPPFFESLAAIPAICGRFLSFAQKEGFKTARLMLLPRGPSNPFPILHAGVQMARGLRDWFHTNPSATIRVIVHSVDKKLWFNIESGRLNLLELLATDTMQVVILVRHAGHTVSRQYRIVGPLDTVADLAKTVYVPLTGWTAEIKPSPLPEPVPFELSSEVAEVPLFHLGLIPGSFIHFEKK